jgi:hypothetical protein
MLSIDDLKHKIQLLSKKRHTQALDAEDEKIFLDSFRELADIASKHNSPRDECEALTNLCALLADENPEEVIILAERFFAVHSGSNEWLRMHVEDALAVAYNHLSDEISAMQHRARALDLGKRVDSDGDSESLVLSWKLRNAFRYADTKTPIAEQFVVRLRDGQDVAGWLSEKSQISISDVSPTLGKFITNDRKFYREAMDRVRMLSDRLRNHLSKPDNYLLIADPGSGKSFFVKQFKKELETAFGQPMEFLERNMSAYNNIEEAFSDIVIDVMISLMTRSSTLLFIDEVDTQLNGKNMFQRLIAPMNGDPFFFSQKQVSFSKQNIVIFYALSVKTEEINKTQKWPDFLSRIPTAHQIILPKFDSPFERIYRAISILPRGPSPVLRVEAAALLYIGLRSWASSRELEQALELAKSRITQQSEILKLTNVASSWQDIEAVSEQIFAGPTNVLEIADPPAVC